MIGTKGGETMITKQMVTRYLADRLCKVCGNVWDYASCGIAGTKHV